MPNNVVNLTCCSVMDAHTLITSPTMPRAFLFTLLNTLNRTASQLSACVLKKVRLAVAFSLEIFGLGLKDTSSVSVDVVRTILDSTMTFSALRTAGRRSACVYSSWDISCENCGVSDCANQREV